MNFIKRFASLKCSQHPQSTIANICLHEACTHQPDFCQKCMKLHLDHTNSVIFVNQLDNFLQSHSNVNEVIQDKDGLEAFKVFQSFKQSIENKLNELENELRKLILTHVNTQLLNESAELFLKEVYSFENKDIKLLRKRLMDRMKEISKNQIILKESPSKQELQQLTNYIKDKLPAIQKDIMNHLEAANTTFYMKEFTIQRLSKVLIENDGQSRPSVFNNSLWRVNTFTLKDQPLYLVGVHQPMMYVGSFNSSSYNSQNKPHTLIYKIHRGTDLTTHLLEHIFEVNHEQQLKDNKLQLVDGHCYYVQFKCPIKLEEQQTYTISVSTNESKQFLTYQYSNPVMEDKYIIFQGEDLNDSPVFQKSPYIQQVYSHHSIDQLPALVVKCKI